VPLVDLCLRRSDEYLCNGRRSSVSTALFWCDETSPRMEVLLWSVVALTFDVQSF